MDSLKEYASLSSSDEEQELTNNRLLRLQNPENESNNSFVCDNKIKPDNREIAPKYNYFNLKEVEKQQIDPNMQLTDTKSVTVQCGTEMNVVDIPNSDFWSDVEPYINVPVTVPTSTNTPYTTPYKTGLQTVKRKHVSNEFYDLSKLQNMGMTSPTGPNEIDRERTKMSSHNSLCTDEKERKLYYVHQKISPHLLQRSTMKFKYPRKLFKNIAAHVGVVNRVKWCVAMYSHLLASVSMDGTAKIWNPWSTVDPCLRTITCHSKAAKDIDWSRTGKEILTCSYDRTAAYTDVEKGLTLSIFDHPGFVFCGKHHHGNPNLIITGTTDKVLCWDVRDAEKPIKTFMHKDSVGQVQDVVLSRDGSQLFACTNVVSRDSADRSIICWDFNHGVVLSNQIYQERYMCTRLKIHPSENYVLVQSHGNYVAVFSANPPYKLNRGRRFEGHKLGGNSIGFDVSPDGSSVMSGSCDGRVYMYNYHSGRLGQSLNTGHDIAMDVCIHPVLYSTVAVGSWSGQISLWQ